MSFLSFFVEEFWKLTCTQSPHAQRQQEVTDSSHIQDVGAGDPNTIAEMAQLDFHVLVFVDADLKIYINK